MEAYPEHTRLLKEARHVNDGQAERILDRLKESGSLPGGAKIALLGASYKADIDDPRESPALRMATAAMAQGYQVSTHDPLVKAGDHHGLIVSNDLAGCLRGAAAAVLLTEHKVYRGLAAELFARHMTGRVIFDARNWLNHLSLRAAGFSVLVLGVR